jgi:PAS domain S-box-containing protein
MDNPASAGTVDASHLHASLVEAMPDAVIATDGEFRVTLWNPAAERLYGYTAEEAIGRFARELATYDGDTARPVLERGLARRGRARIEFTARRRDGTFVDVELIATALLGEGNRVVGHVGIHRDVTERKRAEAEHRRLSAIVENSADVIGMTDLEGHLLYMNPAGQRLVGLSGIKEVRARELLDFFPSEMHARVRDELVPKIVEEGRGTWELDLVNVRTGHRIPVSCDGFRVDDPDTGEPVALATISRDLSERRRAAAELEAYRRRIDTIMESISDAFYALDPEFRFEYLNNRAVQLVGELAGEPLTLEDLLGREVFAILPGFAGTDAERTLRRALDEQHTFSFEFLYPPGHRCFDLHVYPSEGGLAVYFRDVTARKAVERSRELQARQQAAVAELGVRASRGEDAIELMDEAMAVVARTLDVDLVAVTEHVPAQDRLVLRAGRGWKEGTVGRAEAGTGGRLFAQAFQTDEPVVSEDVGRDERGLRWPLLAEHGVASAAVVPIPGRTAPFGTFGVFTREPRRFGAADVNFLRAIANVLYGAIERAQVAHRMREVRDAERRRIARSLHDETLQELAVALSAAARGGDVDDGLAPALRRVGEQIRAAIHDLRLGDEQERPFPRRVEDLVRLHRSMSPYSDFTVAIQELPDRLPGDTSTHVLRVLGEALTNARRHANARTIEVAVSMSGGSLIASVADDGDGFDVEAAAGGSGTVSMRERAELLGGELRIAQREGGGTVVELRTPVFEPWPPGERVRVLLVDDHAAIREALALAFAEDDGLVVTGQAGSLADARTMLEGVDVAIIDLTLPAPMPRRWS